MMVALDWPRSVVAIRPEAGLAKELVRASRQLVCADATALQDWVSAEFFTDRVG